MKTRRAYSSSDSASGEETRYRSLLAEGQARRLGASGMPGDRALGSSGGPREKEEKRRRGRPAQPRTGSAAAVALGKCDPRLFSLCLG
jgi:hypothetical protein